MASYYGSTGASCFGGVEPRGNEDLETYVDSILPGTFRPSFGEDLDARRSLDLDLGAASLWPDDSRDELDACLDFSGKKASGFTSAMSYHGRDYSVSLVCLFDLLKIKYCKEDDLWSDSSMKIAPTCCLFFSECV